MREAGKGRKGGGARQSQDEGVGGDGLGVEFAAWTRMRRGLGAERKGGEGGRVTLSTAGRPVFSSSPTPRIGEMLPVTGSSRGPPNSRGVTVWVRGLRYVPPRVSHCLVCGCRVTASTGTSRPVLGSVMRAPSCDVLLGCRTGRQVAGGEPVAGQVGKGT